MKYAQTTISESLHKKLRWLAFKKGIKIREALRQAIEMYTAQIPIDTDLTQPPKVMQNE